MFSRCYRGKKDGKDILKHFCLVGFSCRYLKLGYEVVALIHHYFFLVVRDVHAHDFTSILGTKLVILPGILKIAVLVDFPRFLGASTVSRFGWHVESFHELFLAVDIDASGKALYLDLSPCKPIREHFFF